MANDILHDQTYPHSLASAVIKIVDDPEVKGAINVRVEYSSKIDNNSPSHQLVENIVKMLNEGWPELCSN